MRVTGIQPCARQNSLPKKHMHSANTQSGAAYKFADRQVTFGYMDRKTESNMKEFKAKGIMNRVLFGDKGRARIIDELSNESCVDFYSNKNKTVNCVVRNDELKHFFSEYTTLNDKKLRNIDNFDTILQISIEIDRWRKGPSEPKQDPFDFMDEHGIKYN